MILSPHQVLKLRDIHMPGPPSWWPPAPGWWLLAAVLLALAGWLAVIAVRRYRIRRRRRRALSELADIEEQLASEGTPYALARVSVLLRQLALARFPRRDVAALSGERWLRFLDESGGNGRFSRGPGRVLGAAPYQRSLPPDLDAPGLIAVVREWVGANAGA